MILHSTMQVIVLIPKYYHKWLNQLRDQPLTTFHSISNFRVKVRVIISLIQLHCDFLLILYTIHIEVHSKTLNLKYH